MILGSSVLQFHFHVKLCSHHTHTHTYTHTQVVGSSLLFVFDASMTNIHLIDFGKTVELPPSVRVDHRLEWQEGNHEDGYLWGLDHLINLWREL